MAECPNRVWCAPVGKGIYCAPHFTASGDQPVWAAVNAGLGSLSVASFCLDRSASPTDARMFAIAGGDLYRRTDGDWAVALSEEDAQSLVSDSSLHLRSVITDPVNGYVHVLMGVTGGDYHDLWDIRSTDHGDTWSAYLIRSGLFFYGIGGIDAYDGVVTCMDTHVIVMSDTLRYSIDNGEHWTGVSVSGLGAYAPYSLVSRASRIIYGTRADGSVHMFRFDPDTATLSYPAVSEDGWDGYSLWLDPDDADHACSFYSTFRETRDDFATWYDEQADLDNHYNRIAEASQYGLWVHGRDMTGALVAVSTDGYTTSHRSGANYNTSPYTDALPGDAAGIVNRSLWAVFDPPQAGPPPSGTTLTPPAASPITLAGPGRMQGVTMPGYTGVDRSIPLPGDRSAFDVDNYPEEHAADLHMDTPTYHNPWPMAAGEAAVSDGTKLVSTDVATQDELDTHEGTPDAHHDPVTLGAGNDADMATLSTQELTVVLKDHEHAGIAGDGGQIEGANLKSTGVAADKVLTADGADGSSWGTPAAIGEYRQFVCAPDGAGSFSFVVDGDGMPVFALLALE